MARCAGKTRSGTRCKRDAVEGSAYCTLHEEQDAVDGAGGDSPGAGADSYRSPTSDALIVLGVAAATWAVLRRVLRMM